MVECIARRHDFSKDKWGGFKVVKSTMSFLFKPPWTFSVLAVTVLRHWACKYINRNNVFHHSHCSTLQTSIPTRTQQKQRYEFHTKIGMISLFTLGIPKMV